MGTAALPRHDEIGAGQRAFELASILAAGAMLSWQGLRLSTAVGFTDVWLLLVVVAAFVAADFASGIVHWSADTWGSDTLPVIGGRLLRPFRVHHVNPDDFIRRDFIDTNGDVSLLVLPALTAAAVMPIDGTLMRTAVTTLVSFAVAGWLTNQVHQWAHVPHAPRVIAWLQRYGILLSLAARARHHQAPYSTNYCIALGWLNRPLAAVRFFPRMESLVTRWTGLIPRRDDAAFAEKVAS